MVTFGGEANWISYAAPSIKGPTVIAAQCSEKSSTSRRSTSSPATAMS
jgi:hypothetical protein